MVVALGPGRFYGSSLPRPRLILPSVEDDGMGTRVEPVGVLDPLLSWANEAHWSMGGLSFKRLRLQGRIEGNLKKLRSDDHNQHKPSTLHNKKNLDQPSPPPPAAPKPKPIRRRLALIDDSDDDDDEVIESDQDDEVIIEKGKRKRPMKGRKLEDDFHRVATSDPSVTSQDGDLNPSLEKKKKKMITREGRDKGSSISINDGARRTLRSSSSTTSSKVFSTPTRTSPRLSSAR